MLSAQEDVEGPLLVSRPTDIAGSVFNDTIVRHDCSLHIRGNLKGSLTIEAGADVTIEGSVDGKVINKGGKLVIKNRGIAEHARREGPPEAEAGGILKINLTAVAVNWEALAGRTRAECAAVVKADAYGCGIDPVTGALAEVGCKTFFVSDLAEARRVRAVAPKSTVYVLNGFYPGTAPIFAELDVQPVINSPLEMAEWDVFVAASQWPGGFALNVDTGTSRLGLSLEEAAAFAPRTHSFSHGIKLLMSRLDNAERPDDPRNARQINVFQELSRLYVGVPASLASSSGIFLGSQAHFDLVRAGSALYGVNPTPAVRNPMIPVIELRARIMQVRNLAPEETIASMSWTVNRPTRLAIASIGCADGFPRSLGANGTKLQAMVGGKLCKIAGRPSMGLLAIDVTDLPTPTAARRGEMVTLIGDEFGIDNLAAATQSSGREILGNLGRRFHRIYYAI